MTPRSIRWTIAIAGFSLLSCLPAQAAVNAYFSAGGDCKGEPVAHFSAGGAPISVSLCMSASTESICGHSVQLEAESPAVSGKFEVVSHRMGDNYPDSTMDKLSAAIAVTHPPTQNDYGGTRDNPQSPSPNQLLVVFTLRPLAAATDGAYVIRLGRNSLVSVGKNGTCLDNSEVRLSASLKLLRK